MASLLVPEFGFQAMEVVGVVIPELIALVTEGEPASHGIGRWFIEEAEDSAPFHHEERRAIAARRDTLYRDEKHRSNQS
jgi:hypothetical protein